MFEKTIPNDTKNILGCCCRMSLGEQYAQIVNNARHIKRGIPGFKASPNDKPRSVFFCLDL